MLELIEIHKKLEQGATEPYLCTANDGEKYIVKGNTALARGRICEYVCAHIGKSFGLPIPNFDDFLDTIKQRLLAYKTPVFWEQLT